MSAYHTWWQSISEPPMKSRKSYQSVNPSHVWHEHLPSIIVVRVALELMSKLLYFRQPRHPLSTHFCVRSDTTKAMQFRAIRGMFQRPLTELRAPRRLFSKSVLFFRSSFTTIVSDAPDSPQRPHCNSCAPPRKTVISHTFPLPIHQSHWQISLPYPATTCHISC